jgi:hypothetical protein
MPLFYFSVHNGKTIKVEEGTNLPDLEAVRNHALQVAGELRKGKSHELGKDWTIVATDDQGRTVFKLPLGEGTKIAGT